MSSPIIVISPPERISSEIRKVIALFESGLQHFHVRKPGFTDFDMINYITSIPKKYRKYLVLHSHYHLAKEFGLKGIQVGKDRIEEAKVYENDFKYYGYSAHSFEEVLELKDQYSHFFLSPIYNSISKENYSSNFCLEDIRNFIDNNKDINLIALGGLNVQNSKSTIDLGFKGIALLGAIWLAENSLEAFNDIQTALKSRPIVLTIAGFDPSSGAGVAADIKSFEQHRVQGLSVTTAITYQNESEFLGVDWLSFEQIKKQIDVLFFKYSPEFVKIGLIESFQVLRHIIKHLKSYNSTIKIIWDPILKSSSEFNFHQSSNTNEVYSILKDIYLLTPNIPECKALFGTLDFNEIQKVLNESEMCSVLLKGGHSNSDKGTDILIEKDNISHFIGEPLKYKTKHGTGCVLSSAICSNLAKGMDLYYSIKLAKNYVAEFIDSNPGLLGYHNIKDV